MTPVGQLVTVTGLTCSDQELAPQSPAGAGARPGRPHLHFGFDRVHTTERFSYVSSLYSWLEFRALEILVNVCHCSGYLGGRLLHF